MIGGSNLYSFVGNNPISGIDPIGLWTFQIGYSLNFQILGIAAVNSTAGFAVDDKGNLARYASVGPAFGVGAKASIGISIAGSNARTVNDLGGPFFNESIGAGDGVSASYDSFQGVSGDKAVIGFGITGGVGIGGGASGSITDTAITPINYSNHPSSSSSAPQSSGIESPAGYSTNNGLRGGYQTE